MAKEKKSHWDFLTQCLGASGDTTEDALENENDGNANAEVDADSVKEIVPETLTAEETAETPSTPQSFATRPRTA